MVRKVFQWLLAWVLLCLMGGLLGLAAGALIGGGIGLVVAAIGR